MQYIDDLRAINNIFNTMYSWSNEIPRVFPDIFFTDFQIPCVFLDTKYNFQIP